MSRKPITLLVLLGALVAVGGCKPKGTSSTEGGPTAPHYAGKPVPVELFIMSQCPYGVQAEKGMFPALEKLGDAVQFKLGFIGQGDASALSSMHGPKEVEGDMVQACAVKHAPAAYRKLIDCMNQDMRSIPGNWEKCAAEAKVDVAAVKACKDGDEGKQLLATAFAEAKDRGARGSPSIFINGQKYQGPRGEREFLRGICLGFSGQEPPVACKDIPPPAKVAVKILTDKRCKECNPQLMLPQLKSIIPGLEVETLDWADAAGKQLMAEAKVKYLPAFLFDASIEKEPAAFSQLGRFLEPAGPYKSLRLGAKFDPTAEVCDNSIDDTGDGKVDCADATCAETLACRTEKSKRLDVFVMSQCPFGVMALDSVKEVLENFKGAGIELGVHFIASVGENGAFKSLHGADEVAEDLRQICALNHYPKDFKFMDYIWCRNKDIKGADWQACTGKNGIDAKVIEACATGEEGKKLLAADAKLTEELSVEGSPTWLVNNRFIAEGADAETIKTGFCAHNKLPGCEKTLTGRKAQAGGAAPQGGSCGN